MNDESFKDRERTMKEILSLFFKTLYMWRVAYVSPLSISYCDLFFLLFLVRYFFLYTSCILGGTLHFY
jgi:hypothetical protein